MADEPSQLLSGQFVSTVCRPVPTSFIPSLKIRTLEPDICCVCEGELCCTTGTINNYLTSEVKHIAGAAHNVNTEC